MLRLIVGALLFGGLAANATASPESSAAPAASPPALTVEPASPERRRLATRLVDLVHPDQVSIDANMRGWDSGMRRLLGADPAFAKLESSYPGVVAAAIDGARPVALEFSRDYVANVKSLKADVFARRLSSLELQQAIAFFEKPAGQKFARRMAERADPAELLDTIKTRVAAGGKDLTVADLATETHKTSRAVISDMSSAEIVQIMRFESLPAAKKFAAAGQEAEARLLELLKNVDPTWLKRQQEAVERAAVGFVEAKAGK